VDARSLKYIAEACRGELRQGLADDTVSRVSTDSRQVQPGDLFIPLKGDRFDAHDFISDVAAKGATAILIENAKMPIVLPKCGVIAVESTRQALGQLAARYRRDFDLPVVAIGGSNGKTSSKEILATVLRQKFATLASEASFNNDVGTPLSLMRLDRTHGAAVLEVGTNHPGELAPLVRMVQPRIGVITSIGREHLEFFGSVDGVAEEEGQLAELLPPDGVFFTNGDSEWAGRLAQRTRARVVKAGLKEGNDWRARDLRMDDRGMNFVVETPRADLSGEYRVSLLGRHQVVNAILGTAVGAELGLDREQLQRALAECAPAKMRLQLFEAGGVRVLNDAYNANADSMRAALDTLRELSCEGRQSPCWAIWVSWVSTVRRPTKRWAGMRWSAA